jgi:two-component system sensor histidine kinase/response regulator
MMPLIQQPQTYEPPRQVPRVLAVEPDRDVCQRLQKALEADYRLSFSHSGGEAFSLLRKETFDLVLLDIALTDVAALELLSRIRSMALAPDTPIILIAPRGNDREIVGGLQQGANDYVATPFDLELLRARMKSQLIFKKRLDEQQQTITSLQHRQEIKDRFLRIATHDLKNPLNNILLAHFQLRNVVGDQPDAAEALDAIEDTVHSMSNLVEDFLDSAVLENGHPEMALGRIDIQQVVAEVVMRFEASARRKDIQLVMGEASGAVLADYARLAQILNNFVSNAIKFSTSNTAVTITSENRTPSVRIRVSDQGPGIPAEEREKLFKPFSKLSPRPTAGESSTGLGLWIVQELARLQNGTVGVECPPQGGSTFWVDLPVYET